MGTQPPACAAAGWCDLHQCRMNYRYIRQHHCVVPKRCKHLWWMDGNGEPTIPLNPAKASTNDDGPAPCEESEAANVNNVAEVPV